MSLLGNVISPPTPYIGSIPGGNLSPGVQIIIQGNAYNSDGFGINLASGPAIGHARSDTAFHFNPRFKENCVVRNTLNSNVWGSEERHNGMPFIQNVPFEIVILTNQQGYKVSVNNSYFCDFNHRLPLSYVNTITVEGGVIISAIRFIGPQPPPYQPPGFSYPSSQPMPIYNPAVPLTTGIPNGLYHGKMIFISGTPTAVTRFTVNIQEGALHNADVGMHFDVRLKAGTDVNTIVRNHRSRGNWGQEERGVPYFPFVPNVPFEMIILCENSGFKVAVNNQHFVEFKHRLMPFARFNMLVVSGDITLNQVRFQ